MGRNSTGAWTVGESLRIELPYLLSQGYIQKGYSKIFTLSWHDQFKRNKGSISCRSNYLGHMNYLEVSYVVTTRDGNSESIKYKIDLIEKDSNLGQGKVLYFQCPRSGKNCRILYKAYGSSKFLAREAYEQRIYYDCQQASKLEKYNTTYWKID
jgi:hypothetical protein